MDAPAAVLVAQAETGRSFVVPANGADSVLALKTALVQAADVELNYQILLLAGDKLENEHALAEYSLPVACVRSRTVFLFDRRSLSRSAPVPDPKPTETSDIVVPETLAADELPERPTEIPSPLIRALIDYERHFKLHMVQATALFQGGCNRLELSRQALGERTTQAAAVQAAVANLRGFSDQLSERYSVFQTKYADVMSEQAELRDSFEVDIQLLATSVLEPALCQLEGWESGTLLDCCGEERLRTWLQECQHNSDHLNSKAAQFALQWDELQKTVQAEEDDAGQATLPDASEAQLRAADALTQQQSSVVEQIRRDAQTVQLRVDDVLAPAPTVASASEDVAGFAAGFASGTASGTASATAPAARRKLLQEGVLEELEETHERHLQVMLPQVRSLDAGLREVQVKAFAAKAGSAQRLFVRLRGISHQQSQIAELRNKLHLYTSLLGRVSQYCSQLVLMRRLPTTYRACLDEVVLRRDFGCVYAEQAREAAETLASSRELERERREEFMREHGALLPRGLRVLSELLQAQPPYIEVNSRQAGTDTEQRIMELSQALGPASSRLDVPPIDPQECSSPTTSGCGTPYSPGPASSLEQSQEAMPRVSETESVVAELPPPGRYNTHDGTLVAAGEGPPMLIRRSLSAESALQREGRRRRRDGWGSPLALAETSPLTFGAVLSAQRGSELSELNAALEALGTPMEGLPVEVASQLQQRICAQEGASAALEERVAEKGAALSAAEAALVDERRRSAWLQAEVAALRAQLLGTPATAGAGGDAGVAAAETATEAADATAEAEPGALKVGAEVEADAEAGAGPEVATESATEAALEAAPEGYSEAVQLSAGMEEGVLAALRAEVATLEEAQTAALREQQELFAGVKTAMSCLPPPQSVSPPKRSSPPPTASSSSPPPTTDLIVDADAGGGAAADEGGVAVARQWADRLTSSARQAAHANARLGHAMAEQREAHKSALALATRRLGYLSADVNSRLLFVAQPARHASLVTPAFGALLLPTLPGGLPTHWLSEESTNSLRRWCDDEGVAIHSLRGVVGRVVQVEGPEIATADLNPFDIPEGGEYCIVHAELMGSSRWDVL